jgi:hypothetical protein
MPDTKKDGGKRLPPANMDGLDFSGKDLEAALSDPSLLDAWTAPSRLRGESGDQRPVPAGQPLKNADATHLDAAIGPGRSFLPPLAREADRKRPGQAGGQERHLSQKERDACAAEVIGLESRLQKLLKELEVPNLSDADMDRIEEQLMTLQKEIMAARDRVGL